MLPTLLGTAIAVDFIVIRDCGVSAYCVTMAYVFMVPAYALLWLGGVWMRCAHRHDLADLARWVASLGISASLARLRCGRTRAAGYRAVTALK